MNEDNKGGDPAPTVHRAIMLTVRPLSEPGKTLSQGQYSVIFFLKVNPRSGEVDWWRHQPLSKQSSINKMSSRGLWSLKSQVRRSFLNLTHLYSCISVGNVGIQVTQKLPFASFSRSCGQWSWSEALIAVSELCCVKNKTSLFADGRNDKKRKTGERDRGRRVWLNGGIAWSSSSDRGVSSQPTEGPLLVSFHGDKRSASRQLSKAICQMALAPWPFCQTQGLFGRVYLSQQRRPLHGYSLCSGRSGEVRELCLCNFTSLNAHCGPAVWRLTESIRTQNHNQTRNVSFYTTLTNRHLKV